MKYTANDIQIILIHPVVSTGQGGAKVVDHPVYIYIFKLLMDEGLDIKTYVGKVKQIFYSWKTSKFQ